jgi:hypothetical protein
LPSGIVLASDINRGLYVLAIDFSIVVPVEYSQFSVQKSTNAKYSEIYWTTAIEINNSHFQIQRSTDGKVFSKIGTIEGQKNSNISKSYGFVDKNPQIGQNFYRLKQVDLNGNINYSDIVQLSFQANGPFIQIYPNPGNGKSINLEMESPMLGQYEAVLMDSSGKRVFSHSFFIESQPVSQQLVINFDQTLSAGAYHLIIMKDSIVYSSQVYLVN